MWITTHEEERGCGLRLMRKHLWSDCGQRIWGKSLAICFLHMALIDQHLQEQQTEPKDAPPSRHWPGPTHRDAPPWPSACCSMLQQPMLHLSWAVVPAQAPASAGPCCIGIQALGGAGGLRRRRLGPS